MHVHDKTSKSEEVNQQLTVKSTEQGLWKILPEEKVVSSRPIWLDSKKLEKKESKLSQKKFEAR